MPDDRVRVFLAGDVMTGRGVDQILAHPGDPRLYEAWVKSAIRYVELAEQAHGPIPRGVQPGYVWGDALEILDGPTVDVRIVNLETAITDRGDPCPDKGIHYRMHPGNADVLTAARIDCCVLANNHVLDWSFPGLERTLETLHASGIATAGAGHDIREARAPAVVETGTGRRVVAAGVGMPSSGIPTMWAAGEDEAGVWLLPSLTDSLVEQVGAVLETLRRPGDVTVVSIHWGPNWGYHIPRSHRRFAQALIDTVGVDIVHGHSSHHPIGVEIYRGKLILYGCGDLINDYEGIGGEEKFRPDLGGMYLVTMGADGLEELTIVPTRLRRFRLERAGREDAAWLARTLTMASRRFGTRFEVDGEGMLRVHW